MKTKKHPKIGVDYVVDARFEPLGWTRVETSNKKEALKKYRELRKIPGVKAAWFKRAWIKQASNWK